MPFKPPLFSVPFDYVAVAFILILIFAIIFVFVRPLTKPAPVRAPLTHPEPNPRSRPAPSLPGNSNQPQLKQYIDEEQRNMKRDALVELSLDHLGGKASVRSLYAAGKEYETYHDFSQHYIRDMLNELNFDPERGGPVIYLFDWDKEFVLIPRTVDGVNSRYFYPLAELLADVAIGASLGVSDISSQNGHKSLNGEE